MAKDPKAIALLLGTKKPEAEPDGDEAGASEGEKAAAGGVMAALQSGDAGSLARELRTFVELVMNGEGGGV